MYHYCRSSSTPTPGPRQVSNDSDYNQEFDDDIVLQRLLEMVVPQDTTLEDV